MKPILTLFFVLLFSFCACFAQDSAKSQNKKIKTFTIVKKRYENGVLTTKSYTSEIIYYNKEGKADSTIAFNEKGTKLSAIYFKYDNQKRMVYELYYLLGGDSSRQVKTIYDSIPYKTSFTKIKGKNDTIYYFITKFDLSGNEIETMHKSFKRKEIYYSKTE